MARGEARLAAEARHLAVLAAHPRPTGTPSAADARRYCTTVLADLDFSISERSFEYSAFPGRYGTPLAGVWSLATLLSAASMAIEGRPRAALVALLVSLIALVGVAGWVARRGVLAWPSARAQGVNIEARRGTRDPVVWLTAHLDCKSQFAPMLARVAGFCGLAMCWTLAIACAVASLRTEIRCSAWASLLALAAVAALPVIATLVGDRSPGAVDNASGVAAVLLAAAELPRGAPVGVLITDAEELGLAGARAAARTMPPATCLNCDGVDDHGTFLAMYSGRRPRRVAAAMVRIACEERQPIRVRRVMPGMLVDSVAFADAGWHAITLSRGTMATLRRVHTRSDDLAHMSGGGLPVAAHLLARAALALC